MEKKNDSSTQEASSTALAGSEAEGELRAEIAEAVRVIEWYATVPQDVGAAAQAFLKRRAEKGKSPNV